MESRQERLKEILAEAVARSDAAARAAYLEEACAGDEALRAKVEALARAYEAEGDFVEATLGASGLAQEAPGAIIGHYKLLQEIGEGGFGVVFMAEQLEPIRRRVALKIVKPGMDTKQVIARFEAERQALALMDHPNIAKILDAGITEAPHPASGHPLPSSDEGRGQGEGSQPLAARHSPLAVHYGRPYFVMELVQGVPITQFCDANELSPPERLKLFLTVCEAVQHAHQKGIIHRDLKPSNILVTLHDGKPVPKVIDFGTAKALQQRLTEKTLFTAYGKLIGTPQYMSPEQAEMSGLDVDTRADIYALGVLLYELLTGTTPFEAERLRAAAFEEMMRIIRQEEPPKPSTRVSTLGARVAEIAKHRQVDPALLRRTLQGDLDWIVMKALEKDRTRRYATANDFAEDLQRHLEHEPVLASPPSTLYRARKFVRRHRIGVAMGATVTVALVAGLSLALMGLQRAVKAETATRRERDRALTAEAKAQSERDIADAVNQFLQQDLLAQASPMEQPDRDVKLRTLVDRAAEKVGTRFQDKPLVEAEIRLTLRWIYSTLGEYTNARAHLDRALEIYKQRLSPEDPKLLKARRTEADLLFNEGRYGDAQKLLEQLLQIHRRVLGPDDPVTLDLMNSLAGDYAYGGRVSEARKLMDELLSLRRGVASVDETNTLLANYSLAMTHLSMSQWAQAQKLLEEVLPAMHRVFGSAHQHTLGAMGILARAYLEQGKQAEAQKLEKEVLAAQQQILGPEHPRTLSARHEIAWTYHHQGRLVEAQRALEEVVAAKKRVLGPEHPGTLVSKECLGWSLFEQGKLDEAEELWRETLSIERRVLGPNHKETLSTANGLAQLSGRKADWPQAVACCQGLIAASTGDVWVYRACALAALASGQADIYRAQCAAMLSRFGQTTNGSEAGATARTCLLEPSPRLELAACVRLADLSYKADPASHSRQLAKGMAEYRQGHWQEALQTMKGPAADDDLAFAASAHFLIALAHHQLHDAEEAERALEEANRLLEQVLWCGRLPRPLKAWSECAAAMVLRSQAEQAVLDKEVSPPVTAESLALLREKWAPVRELLRQAEALAEKSKWKESRDAYARALAHPRFIWAVAEEQSSARSLALHMGVTFVKAADGEAYERHCRFVIGLGTGSPSPGMADKYAKTCLMNWKGLSPGVREPAVKLARDGLSRQKMEAKPVSWWLCHTAGMAEYYASNYTRTIELLEHAEKSDEKWGRVACRGGAMVYRAMALKRLGREEEARQVLAQAEELLAEPTRTRSGANWWDLDICQLALNEARQLIGQPPKR